MRLYIVSLSLALFFLLPFMEDLFDFSAGALHGVAIAPFTGLSYMTVFFHELGHTLTAWLFGYPALPSFDFQHGGGMTYGFDRLWFLQIGVIVLMVAGIGYLFKTGHSFLFKAALFSFLPYLALALTAGHLVMMDFMGHGAELAVAAFCMLRAALNLTEGGVIERYLQMTFGLFVMCHDMLKFGGLVFSDIARDAYAMEKNMEVVSDFNKIAEALHISTPQAALLGLAYLAVMLLGTFVLAFIWRTPPSSALSPE